ncbi:MAG: NAD-dependent epimerase/dehydratase family protein [Nitrospirae bacterium]|nr:NAD-dependent epimerase/dehydratase family protein [Nitrospirota bacterium]
MKILVTGGAGFIGSNVVDGYINNGYDVVIVDNLSTGNIKNINPKAKFYLLDVRSKELEKIFEIERPDIVNHHAAQMSVPASVSDPANDADINIRGLINILNCAVEVNVKKTIFISSGGAVYGESANIPTPETQMPIPLSPYAITKFTSELYLNYYLHQFGLHYTVLRYSNIFGPRQVPHAEAGVVAIFMSLLKEGKLPIIFHFPDKPDGMTRDYCYVKDVVSANIKATATGDNKVINIGSSTEVSTGELYRTILSACRKKGIALDNKFDSPNKGNARPGDLRRSCIDNTFAKTQLGWTPKFDLNTGITETLETYL